MLKPFDELQPGDFVADMHDGIAPIKKKFGVVFHHQWRIESTSVGVPFPSFPNKQLRVLGVQDDGSLVCGYNYDGAFGGIVVIGKYVTGLDPRD